MRRQTEGRRRSHGKEPKAGERRTGSDRLENAIAMSELPFSPIEQAFEDLRDGKFIILVDDEDRENEGDLVMAAERVTGNDVNFMVTKGRGVLCLSMTRQRCEELNLHLQAAQNTTRFATAFTVTVDSPARSTAAANPSDTCVSVLNSSVVISCLLSPVSCVALSIRCCAGRRITRMGRATGFIRLSGLDRIASPRASGDLSSGRANDSYPVTRIPVVSVSAVS